MRKDLPREITLHVRDTCLCLHLQRAARVVARRFDEAFRLPLALGLLALAFELVVSATLAVRVP